MDGGWWRDGHTDSTEDTDVSHGFTRLRLGSLAELAPLELCSLATAGTQEYSNKNCIQN